MEQILKLLNNLHEDIDFEHEKHLISNHILDSIDIVSLVSDLEDSFNIEIGMEHISDENFENIHAIYEMVQEILKK